MAHNPLRLRFIRDYMVICNYTFDEAAARVDHHEREAALKAKEYEWLDRAERENTLWGMTSNV